MRLWLAIALGGCSLSPRPAPPTAADRIAIVISEKGPHGMRLVAIDESGDRRGELVTPPDGDNVRDSNPTISPDGHWMVFASTRDRTDGKTSLWIAAVGELATPHRLTAGEAVDQHPVWDRDSIVFASTRDGGDFDLWRLPLRDGRPGTATQLTFGPGHEVMPAIVPDGSILYAAITQREGLEVESHLEERAADGTIRSITTGPADTSPAVSPDGSTLVFVRPAVYMSRPQAELWRIDRGAWHSREGELPAQPLVQIPLTDESGPVWSRDGRFVFATSVLRGDGGKPVFSSIIHVDLRDKTPRARILRDRAGALPRLTPAIRTELDAAALDGDPEYLPELARIMSSAIADQTK